MDVTEFAALVEARKARKPADLAQAADGYYYREGRRVCEDCWQVIPRYVDFPLGLVSPDSDGMGGNFAKTATLVVEGKEGTWHQAMSVCLPCYLAAFKRWAPDAALPEFNEAVLEERVPIPASHLAPVEPEKFIGGA